MYDGDLGKSLVGLSLLDLVWNEFVKIDDVSICELMSYFFVVMLFIDEFMVIMFGLSVDGEIKFSDIWFCIICLYVEGGLGKVFLVMD